MTTGNFIGRVGGLAVALGIGAAAFGGSTVAWADAPAAGSDTPSAGQARSTAPSRAASRNSTGQTINRSGASALARSAAVRPQAKAAPARIAATSDLSTPNGSLAVPVPAPASPGSAPAVPVDSPLEWTVLASARRVSAAARVAAAVPAAATQPLILGPSGVPIPSDAYVTKVMDWYVLPNSPDGANPPQVVFTPEGLYPITGVKSLPLNTSVDQGLTILSDTLALLPSATQTTVFGYSQSAIIGSLLQAGYIPPNSPYPNPEIPVGLQDSINFVFVGNEMNPNGGFLSRFPNLNLPSLGIPFYGATPENAYPTTNYTREYDGFADFPRYPLNFLADLNAGLGIVFVHT